MLLASLRKQVGKRLVFAFCLAVAASAAGAPIDELLKTIRDNDIGALDDTLEEYGPECVNAMTRNGVTPLHLAASLDRKAIAGVLVARGADIEAQTVGGFTPLHWAASRDAADTAKLLIDIGAKVNARSFRGITPLHWAAGKNAVKTLSLLINAGAQLHAMTEDEMTPLHWAVKQNAVECAELLASAIVSAELDEPQAAPPAKPVELAEITIVEEGPSADEEAAVETPAALPAETATEPVAPPTGEPAEETPSLIEPPQGKTGLAVVRDEDEMEPETETTPEGVAPAEPPSLDAPDTAVSALPPPPSSDSILQEAAAMEALPDPPMPPERLRTLIVQIGFGQKLEFVWLPALRLWVGRYEITNGQYRRYKPRHSSMFHEEFSLDGMDQPAVYVSWNEANSFCNWLNRNYSESVPKGGVFRLPTDQEWIQAAGCGDKRIYPWGNEWPPRYGNFSDLTARSRLSGWVGIEHYDDGFVVSCPVEKSGENEWGIFGLAGNVWEWCDDWYDASRQYKIRHGGGWDFDGQKALRIDTRGIDRPDASYDTIGLRVVIEPSQE